MPNILAQNIPRNIQFCPVELGNIRIIIFSIDDEYGRECILLKPCNCIRFSSITIRRIFVSNVRVKGNVNKSV